MKAVCALTLFFLFVYAVNAAQITRRTCVTRTGTILTDGAKWKDPDYCTIYKCSIHNGEAELDGITCAAYWIPRGCKSVARKGEYPDCCPIVDCPQITSSAS